MLQPFSRDRIDASPTARDETLRELSRKRHPSRVALAFMRAGLQTRLTHVRQEAPWKVVRSFPGRSGAALVHLHNVSGGLLGGDCLEAFIDVGRDCEVQITTVSSTRVYKAKRDALAAQAELRAIVRDGALLEHVPDSIIPFAQSRFRQRSTFELCQDAGLFAWEVIAPGRCGEPFAFDSLAIETEIMSPRGPVAIDSWRLQPQLRAVTETTRLGPFPYQAAFYVCRAGVPASEWLRWEMAAAEWVGEINSLKQVWGVSALHRDGLMFRGLASEVFYLYDSLIRFWRGMKRELYGREPTLPRKLF